MKKKALKILIPALVVVAVGGGVFWYYLKSGSGQDRGKNRSAFSMDQFGSGSFSGMSAQGSITAQGVTNMGIVSETFDVTELETELIIEEVYVATGDEIKAGDKVLKLTQDSVDAAREELQDKEREAELAYRSGVIEYERSKIVAEYERDSKKLSAEQADAVYQDSLTDLTQNVDRAKEQLSQTKEQIQEYSQYVDNNTYREYFKVDEYQQIYDENLKILTENMEKWGIEWSQVTGQGAGSPGMMSGGMGGGADYSSEYSQWVNVLKSLYSVLEQNASDLDKAKKSYEEAVSSAALDKKLLELSVPELEEKVSQANSNYEKTLLQNQVTKEKSLSDGERAEHDYETAIEKAESDFEVLKSAWEEAKENLEIFEEQIGDGYFYASSDGSILRSSVRAQNVLRAESTIFTYSDPSAMTVTVSVDQSDIAKITPGEAVTVMSQSRVTMSGIVDSVNPISTSESRNNVTYSVTVKLDGAGELGSNESVTVMFGVTLQDMGADQDSTDGSQKRERPEGMPEGFSGEWSGEMPEGWNGEKPEGMPEGFSGEWSGEMPEGFSGERPEGMPEGFSGKRPTGKSEKSEQNEERDAEE